MCQIVVQNHLLLRLETTMNFNLFTVQNILFKKVILVVPPVRIFGHKVGITGSEIHQAWGHWILEGLN
jgi:hypothetical protein